MSGTLGISPIRVVGVVGVMRSARFLRGRVEALRRRGGLALPLAVPVAVAVTATVVWVTVTLASSWVGA